VLCFLLQVLLSQYQHEDNSQFFLSLSFFILFYVDLGRNYNRLLLIDMDFVGLSLG